MVSFLPPKLAFLNWAHKNDLISGVFTQIQLFILATCYSICSLQNVGHLFRDQQIGEGIGTFYFFYAALSTSRLFP